MTLHNQISTWLDDYLQSNNLDCFIIGVSGGIDSALTSTLCAQTGRKTIVVSMPIYQASDQLKRARDHIQWLKTNYSNIESYEYDLSSTFEEFKSLFTLKDELALANSRSRLRMTTLYQLAGMYNGIVVGTGNKIEDFGIGFFTKYGDGGVDISPIGNLSKSEVREMSRELGILREILEAPPTDGLWDDGRTDEEQIGATYEELEWAMEMHQKLKINPLLFELCSKKQKLTLELYSKLNLKNKHKMIPIPVFKK